ncbi:hypothetical protein C0J52_13749 [Blattella germanica]|nr:hypothetical protein C0J52_13749 [Blattella germanica]
MAEKNLSKSSSKSKKPSSDPGPSTRRKEDDALMKRYNQLMKEHNTVGENYVQGMLDEMVSHNTENPKDLQYGVVFESTGKTRSKGSRTSDKSLKSQPSEGKSYDAIHPLPSIKSCHIQ